jgi:hypothetical protein
MKYAQNPLPVQSWHTCASEHLAGQSGFLPNTAHGEQKIWGHDKLKTTFNRRIIYPIDESGSKQPRSVQEASAGIAAVCHSGVLA